jgi:FixJ family two-component response regulator
MSVNDTSSTNQTDHGYVAILDDDAALRRSLSNLLVSVGFNVEAFVSAEAFLDAMPRNGAACMVLDLRMPGMSGLELLRHLAATGSRIPVIVLTGHGTDAIRQQCLDAGAFAFLDKPVRSAALLDTVRRAVNAR